MARCESCKNDYDKAMVIQYDKRQHTFDCFECAIQMLAPVCKSCNTRIIGHGVESDNFFFCSAHCARTSGKVGIQDRIDDIAGTVIPLAKPPIKECIDSCLECHQVCLETLQYCVSKGGAYADPRHLQLLWDCALICEVTAKFMISHSEFHTRQCAVCTEVCRSCAKSCDTFENDLQMKRCTEITAQCADACERMSRDQAA